MAKSKNKPDSVTFTSAGTSLPIWGVRAGMLIDTTVYAHDTRSLRCDVVDKRDTVGEIVRGLRETAKLIADPDRAEEVEQAADNIAAIFITRADARSSET